MILHIDCKSIERRHLFSKGKPDSLFRTPVVDLIVDALMSSQLGSTLDLEIELCKADPFATGCCDIQSFVAIIKKLSKKVVEVEAKEVAQLHQSSFIRSKVDYLAFLCRIKEQRLTDRRLDSVRELFHRLTYKKSNQVDLCMLAELFDGSMHYEAKQQLSSKPELEAKFRHLIVKFIQFYDISVMIEWATFITFWEYVSHSVKLDSHFEYMLLHCFSLRKVPQVDKHNHHHVDQFERITLFRRSISPSPALPEKALDHQE